MKAGIRASWAPGEVVKEQEYYGGAEGLKEIKREAGVLLGFLLGKLEAIGEGGAEERMYVCAANMRLCTV